MRNIALCVCFTFWAFCAGEEKTSFARLLGQNPGSNEVSHEYFDRNSAYGFPEFAVQRSYDDWTPVDTFDVYKRLASGFFGLRGKKDLDVLMDNEKRIPNGFVGMRGKKLLEDYEDPFDKRPSASSFWGMRGKREYDTPYDNKRAPKSRFFGMRGRRQPNKNSFFGMRGKKFVDMRGKFVGVRGKKSYEDGNSEYFADDSKYDDMSLDQLIYLLSQNESD